MIIRKIKIHQRCLELVNNGVTEIEKAIADIREAAQGGAKSSAGDKYETTRAMADLEIEKQQNSLHNLLQMRSTLERMDPYQHHDHIAMGSLVETNQGLIYIAAGLGKITVENKDISVISFSAPVVVKLKETPVGGTAVFNGTKYKILSIE